MLINKEVKKSDKLKDVTKVKSIAGCRSETRFKRECLKEGKIIPNITDKPSDAFLAVLERKDREFKERKNNES